jgi:alpha,alpha-trehalase
MHSSRISASLPALLLAACALLLHADAPQNTKTPQLLFKDLFAAVQDERLFSDGKLFADAVPNESPATILSDYHAKPLKPEALKSFVAAHFRLPEAVAPPPSPPGHVDITEHIDKLWDQLTRSTPIAPAYASLLALPRPYVVPGGRFREMYYWDSYFTMLGLAESGRRDLIEGMVADFAYFIDTFGHVPNGARTYYLSRSQPPFFFAMVGLMDPEHPASAYAKYLPELKREYAFWMEGADSLKPGNAHRRAVALADGAILNRYWDDSDLPRDESYADDTALAKRTHRRPQAVYRDIRAAAESGWDFGSRWFKDPSSRDSIDTTEIIPVDLNSLLYGLEQAIASGCGQSGDAKCAEEFTSRADHRRHGVDRYLWNAQGGAYFDYRYTDQSSVTRISAATLYPLFTHLASAEQAKAVAVTAAKSLLRPGGIVTTPLTTGQQWDAPNGWAPLQWIAVKGFQENGETKLAETVACRWTSIVNDVYKKTGKLVEKYDVVSIGRKGGGGEYPTQDGFGWTNGVQRKLLALYPQFKGSDEAGACH